MKEEKDLFRVFDKLTERRERCLDVKELRIGSHVMFCANGQRCRVAGIDIDDDKTMPILINVLERIEDRTFYKTLTPDEAEPFPLTVELLKELGFERFEGSGLACYTKDGGDYNIAVFYHREYKCFMATAAHASRGKFVATCKHLHQLENVVYMATGKELVKD